MPGERALRFAPRGGVADAATAVFEEIERLKLISPSWWVEGICFYYYQALLLNTMVAPRESSGSDRSLLWPRAATCYYNLGLYEKWEAGRSSVTRRRLVRLRRP